MKQIKNNQFRKSALALSLVFLMTFTSSIKSQTTLNIQSSSLPKQGVEETEEKYLAAKAGTWNVMMTLRPTADARPVTQTLVAERTMIGPFCIHEMMRPSPGSNVPDFQRFSDLAYNKNENNWNYSVIDTRITGGIMYFISYGNQQDSISTYMLNFTHPGLGPNQEGRGKAVRARTVFIKKNSDQDLIKQYWTVTDKPEWLAVQYEYTRKK